MSQNGEKFKILLEQIQFPEKLINDNFSNAEIEKVEVLKNNATWNFHFVLQKPISVDIYCLLKLNLEQTFKHIANITFSIRYLEQETIEDVVYEYLKYTFTELAEQTPVFSYLSSENFTISNNIIELPMNNEAQLTSFKNKYLSFVRERLSLLGFSNINFVLKQITNNEEIDNFIAQRDIEDRILVEQTIKESIDRNDESASGTKELVISIGNNLKEIQPEQISSIQEEERTKTIQGYIFSSELRELKTGRFLLTFKITDYTDSIIVKIFSRDKEDVGILKLINKGMWVKVRGSVQYDTFVKELVLIANDLQAINGPTRKDSYPESEKRVELHVHTQMSQMDGLTSASKYIEQAKKWGHSAIAITDHYVAQSFPEAYSAGKKHGIKIIYGVEGNLVDDQVNIAYEESERNLIEETYVVFDIETTGLSAVYNTIIELAAVKIKNGEIIDKYESFSNPHHPLSSTTIELTGITDEMVENAPEVSEVLSEFKEWAGNAILVAHNASFDTGFLRVGYKKYDLGEFNSSCIDTLELSRALFPEFKNHRLNTLCKKFEINLTQHHRAIFDAEATAYLFLKMLKEVLEKGIIYHNELNYAFSNSKSYQRSRPNHVTIYAKNEVGLKNLYRIISESHINYFYRVPRIPRSLLIKYREGLIIGTSCDKGEVFEAVMQKNPEEVERLAKFYDFIEVHPPDVYAPLIENELVNNEESLKEIIIRLINLGEKLDKPVVVTGNVHYLEKRDALYRKILIASQGGNPLNKVKQPPVYFRTTDEMIEAFNFLEEKIAKKIIIENSQLIANMIEDVKPIKDDLYTPRIDGADEEMRSMSYSRAKSIYGENLPKIVEDRLEKELKSIIGHGFAVIYLISHKLVKKSLDDGYLVGSRGSVGSSFVATMTEITEVNPLPPHYVCPNCKRSEFFDDGSIGSGYDLPDKNCPDCGKIFNKDGHDIPFETFLGFKGDKVPDIDLNFSGEYQPRAHNYTKVLFGDENVFRAGTIGTVADKTAFGYVKGYLNDYGLNCRNAEIERLASGCTGVKRTTGQHPGGIIVVPDYMDIYDFTPVQYPADDVESEWKTTHFDFHSIHDNLLKLDILGHDDPTVIRMLQDLSGIDPKTIPTDDKEVMKIFSSTESLNVSEQQINCKTGTLGIPEFGTRFVRQMLEETKPKTFSELVQISGLSHGTDVWLNNANELIANGTCNLSEVIGCRDDIMVYLIYKGLEPSQAFKIMENVRKGKGLTEEWIEEMKKHNVPDWYINSCQKIKYMFPKAHATAYVLMAVRIAYFKVHYPILFYAAYFSVRADDFDLEVMNRGSNAIKSKIEEIVVKGLEATPKEKNLLTVLEIALEMCERGFNFKKLDLYKSHARNFLVEGNSLIPPFRAISGLGTSAAESVVSARIDGEFLSKEDLLKRSKLSKTILEFLDKQGCLNGLPDQNQLSLF
ncbi:MAG: polC [Bacillales bacterium]|jgi:DNA polymerase-3 subunit alpha (Gram-positive type)|nr:polC [Bacillales bacterium]